MHAYSYGTPIRVWDIILSHTRMGYPIRVWDVPYAYGTIYAYGAEQCHCVCCGVDNQRYVTNQNAEVFNWLCPKCVSNQLPFHDC